MKYVLTILTMLFIGRAHAQETQNTIISQQQSGTSIFNPKLKPLESRKGKWYVFYGYNFSWYAPSDIRFKGKGYDFTLMDVKAKDRPSRLSLDYVNPMQITTPQVNIRFGYFLNDTYSISFGWDHMKYVMVIPQNVAIKGYIDPVVSEPGIPTGKYAGNYNGERIDVDATMLTFEHTDGYNYVSVEVERQDDIWIAKNQKNRLTMETGVGVGTIIPRTDAKFFGVGENHFWNFAGYGASIQGGLKFHITKGLYLQNTLKAGWSRLNNIRTTGRNDIDKASQNISYLQNYTVIGYQF